jgi:hypothetical protein
LSLALLVSASAWAESKPNLKLEEIDSLADKVIPSLLTKAFGNEGIGLLLDHLKASLQATAQDKPVPELDAKTAEKIEHMASAMKKETAILGAIAIDAAREHIFRSVQEDALPRP